jgi:DNA invertase Pin-like site-specific DNA recombinase
VNGQNRVCKQQDPEGGGRPTKKEDKVEIAIKMYKSKDYTIKEITEMTGLSKTTLYRYLEKA